MFPATESDLRVIAPTVARILNVDIPSGSEVEPLSAPLDKLSGTERIALVVLDGFGSAIWKSASEAVPTLNKIAQINGVEISSVIPSLTYVCLTTMLTGISPKAHGVRDLDGAVEAAANVDTVFDSVRRSGQQTLLGVHQKGVMGLPLDRFADWAVVVDTQVDFELYNQLPGLIAKHKPAFVLIHLIDVDEAGHAHGPYSAEVKKAAAEMDRNLKRLFGNLVEENYGLIALADHGMHSVSSKSADSESHLGDHDGSVEEDLAVPLIWATPQELASAI